MNYYLFILGFFLGFITINIFNPLPHFIIKTPNLSDTYVDSNGKIYKYKLNILKN